MNENQRYISEKILLTSVLEDPFKTVQMKIKKYNIIKDESYFDYTLLRTALCRPHVQVNIIRLLLKLGCRTRSNPLKPKLEHTVLHLAMTLNNQNIIIDIIKKGASIYDKNFKGETAIYTGFQSGYHYNVKEVLKFVYLNSGLTWIKSLDPLKRDDIIHFNIAFALRIHLVIEEFLKCKFNINCPIILKYSDMFNVYPVHYAVRKNYSDLFDLFLKYGADLSIKNNKGQTVLHVLYNSGIYGLKMLKLAFTSDNQTKFINSVDENGVSHFHICCSINNCDASKVFIKGGVDVNSATSLNHSINPGFTPLHFSIAHDECNEVLEVLLKSGADIKKVDAKGSTPLHIACKKGNLASQKIIHTLLEYGAPTNIQTNVDKETPLHLACKFKKSDNSVLESKMNLIKLLLQYKADVNITNKNNETPVHLFLESIENFDISHRCKDVFCTMLERVCVFNKNSYGNTVLTIALKKKLVFAVDKLLYYGADINSEDLSQNLSISTMTNIDISKSLRIFEIIFKHVKKLLALGLDVSKKIQEDCFKLHQHYQTYNKIDPNLNNVANEELEKLKIVKIDDCISLYNILQIIDPNELVEKMKNSDLVKILEDQSTYDKFPNYSFLLKIQYKKAKKQMLFSKT